MPPKSRGKGGDGGWSSIESFSTRGEAERSVTEAILNLALDAGDAPDDPTILLRALRVAQTALRGEKTRVESAEERARSAGGAGSGDEVAQLKEKLRITEDEVRAASQRRGGARKNKIEARARVLFF